MRISHAIHVILLFMMVGCTTDSQIWRYDNPTIRRLQEEETSRHFSDEKTRNDLVKQIEERTHFIYTRPTKGDTKITRQFSGGRAGAVTADGYFLTAYHVVQDVLFYLEKTEMIRNPPMEGFPTSQMNKYFSTKRYPGRLVWQNSDLDLAILKFSVTNWPSFTDFKVPPDQGDLVIAADDEGYGFIVANDEGQTDAGNMIGNGDFMAAGLIREGVKKDSESSSAVFSTTLVARGGMSGAPVVTDSQELCGIIVRGEGFFPFQSPRTVAVMIEPGILFEIIEFDRKKYALE